MFGTWVSIQGLILDDLDGDLLRDISATAGLNFTGLPVADFKIPLVALQSSFLPDLFVSGFTVSSSTIILKQG